MRAKNIFLWALTVLASVTLSSGDQEIVDGTSVDDTDLFPWFALYDGDTGSVICGGVLIARDRVLTSARCIRDGNPDDVRVGATTESNGQKIAVSCAKRHPNYSVDDDDFTVQNDLAVLYLDSEADNHPIPSINTNTSYPDKKGIPFVTMGFGLTTQEDYDDGDDDRRRLGSSEEEDDPLPENLQAIISEYKTLDDCKDKYPKDVILSGQHKCMNVKDGGGCAGDQGGPVVDEHERLVGILSFAYGCADNDYYDVFVDVAQYSEWIHDRMYDTCGSDKAKTPAPTPAPTKPCKLDQVATDRIKAIKDRIGAIRNSIRARFGGGTVDVEGEEGGDRV